MSESDDRDFRISKNSADVPESHPVARHDPLAERIRQLIRQAMEEHGLQQKEVARRARVPYRDFHRFYKGDMPYPRLTFLDRVVRVFGYRLSEVLGDLTLPHRPLPPPPITKPAALEIAEIVEHLPDDYAEGVLALVRAMARRKPRRKE